MVFKNLKILPLIFFAVKLSLIIIENKLFSITIFHQFNQLKERMLKEYIKQRKTSLN